MNWTKICAYDAMIEWKTQPIDETHSWGTRFPYEDKASAKER